MAVVATDLGADPTGLPLKAGPLWSAFFRPSPRSVSMIAQRKNRLHREVAAGLLFSQKPHRTFQCDLA